MGRSHREEWIPRTCPAIRPISRSLGPEASDRVDARHRQLIQDGVAGGLAAGILFEDHTREKLQRVLETFAELFGGGEDIEDYCLTVGNYWREVCSDNPAICPVNPNMPDCTP